MIKPIVAENVQGALPDLGLLLLGLMVLLLQVRLLLLLLLLLRRRLLLLPALEGLESPHVCLLSDLLSRPKQE
jgi:hypothetical protein